MRGRRIGEAMVEEAIRRAKAAGCGLVELTTDKRRPDAHRFYERLGFAATHQGMKLMLQGVAEEASRSPLRAWKCQC